MTSSSALLKKVLITLIAASALCVGTYTTIMTYQSGTHAGWSLGKRLFGSVQLGILSAYAVTLPFLLAHMLWKCREQFGLNNPDAPRPR